jgi:hypothetical protein
MEERSRSQSRMRPRPLFADGIAADRSSWPSVSVPLNSTVSQAANPYLLYLEHETRFLEEHGHDDIFSTYRAHVNRSIILMQEQYKRHSWYLLDSLVQMQGALDQTITETARPRPRPVSDDIRELLRQLEIGDNDTSEDETKVALSTGSAGDLAQRSTDTSTSVATRHQDPFVSRNNAIATSEASLPPVPARHSDRPSAIALGKRRAITHSEHVHEDKDVLNDSGINDSGISINM